MRTPRQLLDGSRAAVRVSVGQANSSLPSGLIQIVAFGKLPEVFGFAIEYTDGATNLRSYYPDFVAKADDGTHWLLETKGQETTEVIHKDQAARNWCVSATALTKTAWKYLKVPQKRFETLQPETLQDLMALEGGGELF